MSVNEKIQIYLCGGNGHDICAAVFLPEQIPSGIWDPGDRSAGGPVCDDQAGDRTYDIYGEHAKGLRSREYM